MPTPSNLVGLSPFAHLFTEEAKKARLKAWNARMAAERGDSEAVSQTQPKARAARQQETAATISEAEKKTRRAIAALDFSHLLPAAQTVTTERPPPTPRPDPAKKAAARILAAAARARGEEAPEMYDDPYDRTLKSVEDPKALAAQILDAGKRARGE